MFCIKFICDVHAVTRLYQKHAFSHHIVEKRKGKGGSNNKSYSCCITIKYRLFWCGKALVQHYTSNRGNGLLFDRINDLYFPFFKFSFLSVSVCISLLLLCIPTSCKERNRFHLSFWFSSFSFSSFPTLLLKACFNTQCYCCLYYHRLYAKSCVFELISFAVIFSYFNFSLYSYF